MSFQLNQEQEYTYNEIFKEVIREYKEQKNFPFRLSRKTISNLIKQDKFERRRVTRAGKKVIRYFPKINIRVSKDVLGVDRTTGGSIFSNSADDTINLEDEEGNFVKELENIEVTLALSVDTTGGHQRLMLEMITSTIVKSGQNLKDIEEELKDRLLQIGANKFNPNLMLAAEKAITKEGIQYSSIHSGSDVWPESRNIFVYKNKPEQPARTINESYSLALSKAMIENPHEGKGRPIKQKLVGDFK